VITLLGKSIMRARSKTSAVAAFVLVLAAAPARADDAGAPAGPDAAPIAPPSPGAPPEKVEKAKAQAKEAELTPIVPSPKEPTKPAFQLYAELDLPVLGMGLVFVGARLTRIEKAFCAPLCDPSDLNALDRTTAGWWSPAWSTATDFGLYALIGGSLAVLLVDEGLLETLNDAVVVAESAIAGMAVSSLLTLAVNRPRPFLYGEKAPLADRNSANGSFSYSSSHATVSFAIATSTFMAVKRLHPKSPAAFWVLGIGGATAAFVATGRVMAGMHFISDAVGGAVVGSSMGILVPALHGSPVKIVPVVAEGERGLRVLGSF
jgi:membrane-associated phospholipid phosphatase